MSRSFLPCVIANLLLFSPNQPYLQNFTIVSAATYRAMARFSGKLDPVDFNRWLLSFGNINEVERLVCLPQPGAGLRFRLVSPVKFEELVVAGCGTVSTANGIRVLTGLTEDGQPCVSPHPLVSTWLIDNVGLHEERLSYRFTEIVSVIYGKGFSGRAITANMGANVYLGSRSSEQSTPSPAEGPGRATSSQYFRQEYKHPYLRACIEKKAKDLLARVVLFASRVDFLMSSFLAKDRWQACAVLTQGILRSTYGFMNELHVDAGDSLGQEEGRQKLEEARVACSNVRQSVYTPLALEYLEACYRMIGLGYSTTCGYQHVFHPAAPKERMSVHQFFLMPGLGCTCPIQDGVGHNFLAYAFSHYTSCTIVLLDGYVHWLNDGGVNVVAWGSWQSKPRDKRKKKKRRSKRAAAIASPDESDEVDSEEEEEEAAAAVDLTDEVEPLTDQPQSEAEEDNNSLNHHPTSDDDDDDGDYVDEGVLGEPVSPGPVRRLLFPSLSDASTEGGDDDDVLLQSLRDPNGVAGAAGVGGNVAGGPGDALAAGGVGRVAEAVVAVAAIAAVARTISQIGRAALLDKYDMIESVPVLDAIGEVHNVEGDGNCGFYCLLLALAVLQATGAIRTHRHMPKTQLELRKSLSGAAGNLKHDDFAGASKIIFSRELDHDSRLKEWDDSFGNVYSEAADYSSEEFMHENSQHWMEATTLLPIFARQYRVRVVLYVQQGESDRWQTHIYDGSDGQMHHEVIDGVRVVEPSPTTFGIVHDGEHYRYLQIANLPNDLRRR